MGQYSLRNTIVGMFYGRQGQVRKVLRDVIDAMIENRDAPRRPTAISSKHSAVHMATKASPRCNSIISRR